MPLAPSTAQTACPQGFRRPMRSRATPFGGVPSVTVNVENGVVKYAYTLTQQAHGGKWIPTNLPPAAVQTLEQVQADGHPQTVDLGSLGAYRVVTVLSQATPRRVLILGLSAADINSTLMSASLIMLAVAIVAVLLTALVGDVIIRQT